MKWMSRRRNTQFSTLVEFMCIKELLFPFSHPFQQFSFVLFVFPPLLGLLVEVVPVLRSQNNLLLFRDTSPSRLYVYPTVSTHDLSLIVSCEWTDTLTALVPHVQLVFVLVDVLFGSLLQSRNV